LSVILMSFDKMAPNCSTQLAGSVGTWIAEPATIVGPFVEGQVSKMHVHKVE
jgi:hypothetical protein